MELNEHLVYCPETYKTLLKRNKHVEDTKKRVLNRLLNRLVKDGLVYSATIVNNGQGRRGMERIFFSPQKNYSIVFTKDVLRRHHHYYCAVIQEFKAGYSKMFNAWELDGCKWRPVGNLVIINRNVRRVL